MKQVNIRFLSSVFVFGIFVTNAAFSVPSVKMLGANPARAGAAANVVKTEPKANVAVPQRLGSVRIKNVNPTPVTTTGKATTDSARLSLSNASLNKYLHSPTVSKTVVAKPSVSEEDFTDLSDKVEDLDDAKQDKISAGVGLTLENNVVFLNEDYVPLPTQVDNLEVNLTNNYYTKTDIDGMLDSQTGVDVKTIYDYATRERTYVSIVDDFDPLILN